MPKKKPQFTGWHKWGVSHQLPPFKRMKAEREDLLTCPSSLLCKTSALFDSAAYISCFCVYEYVYVLSECIKIFCFLRARTEKKCQESRGHNDCSFILRGWLTPPPCRDQSCNEMEMLSELLWLQAWSLLRRNSG